METYIQRFYKLSYILLFFILTVYTIYLFQDIFLKFNYSGDENKFLKDLTTANKYGLGQAILDGTSVPYLILSYSFNLIINNSIFSLKLISLISGLILFLVLLLFDKKYLNLGSNLKITVYLWLAYLIITQATIFLAMNDILLALFGNLFFISYFSLSSKSSKGIFITSILLALMLFTRKMAATYIISFFSLYFFLSFFLNHKDHLNYKHGLQLISTSFIVFIILNSYSLISQQKFSFDDKTLTGPVNWAQWDYYNALLIDSGNQERFKHVTLKETENYLVENGKSSLPSTFFEMIFFNPRLTIKEFFIDSAIGIKYLVRQTGLFIFPFSIFLITRIKKVYFTKSISKTDFIYFYSFIYFLMICFIVITNIQPRWFLVFLPITLLLISKDLNKLSKKNQQVFSILNNLTLIIMCLPYIFNKFFN
ncbi:hypothetical protein [Salegentibacter maritimus]|uniref:hypothetical protein n=1 Tax=Salegentibacter maritimus TaxID=2794347 RepID=UPI0018E457A2|nr:hypothetical protein [Salegentibacter maritimus]MBI6118199.1 hypothetical protein [Salegentibacter maritimus]